MFAVIGLEIEAFNKINQSSDFDYHWVGGLTNSTASIVVTVLPHRGTTIVEAFVFAKEFIKNEYFSKISEPKEIPETKVAMILELYD